MVRRDVHRRRQVAGRYLEEVGIGFETDCVI
jgi:hypothetical protein